MSGNEESKNTNDSDRGADQPRQNPYTEFAQLLEKSSNANRSAPGQPPNAAAEPAAEVESLQTQLAETRDKLLRTQAELENYRKRVRREMDDERRYAEIHLIRDLLPIVDNMSRAIDAAEKKADAAALLEGLKMMSQQFQQVLAQHHSKLITDEAIGSPFDPHRHEAILQQPSEEHPEHTVLGVTRPGLELHDRIVRPAQVIVSKRG